jgi:hypothetical protein
MNVKTRTTVPTATVAHAAYVAQRAAIDARKMGATPEQAAHAYELAYAETLRG